MKLRTYLDAEGLTLAVFAARIQRTDATVSRIVRGLHKPDWDTMRLIEAATGGKVTPNDFRDDPDAGADPETIAAAAPGVTGNDSAAVPAPMTEGAA